ncbi:MAG TPA: aminotransferase class III-fold pyridoxal phosphate-dependent enzyme [Candidatus Polarisedimenticolia bacterium]|jgi:glutamate-1-semialdehyde 2,1-aminomutase|nr:aminotransferase class III-fold pyridoxal phosphate-dependent enzyme [Candidatus Polarisedimenticolia bacterium]
MNIDRSAPPRPPVTPPPGAVPFPAPDPLAAELARFKSRSAGSIDELERARRFLPAGVCSNFRVMDPHTLFLRAARGAHVWDVDGHEYVDWSLAQSTLLTGHAHPAVLDAVRRQMGNGTMTCYPNPRTADLARIVCERFRLDLVRFVNTGSEATQYAVRVARGATARDTVLKFDACYHGGAPEFWLGRPETDLPPGAPEWMGQEIYSAGIPRALVSKTLLAAYNDLESARAAFRAHPQEIAAVILEPIVFNLGVLLPREGFLQGLRDLCDREGAVLIYDEVKMGCKLGLKGAGEYFGVAADLVAMAKSIGGGFPIGLFGGRRDLMEGIETRNVKHVGTYAANAIGLAAAHATLTEVLTPTAYDRMFAVNQALADGYREIITRTGIEAHVVTAGAAGSLFYGRAPVQGLDDFKRTRMDRFLRLWVGMANRGILPQAYGPEDIWTVSVQHSDEDVEATLRAFREVAPMLG